MPLTAREYQQHRQRLLAALPDNSVAIIHAAAQPCRNRDAEYPYRQHSDLLYLCGFPEPDACAVLVKEKDGSGRFMLFCQPKDDKALIWTGPRVGVDGAVQQYGADQAWPMSEWHDRLPDVLRNREHVLFPWDQSEQLHGPLMQAIATLRNEARHGVRAPDSLHDLSRWLHALRLCKTAAEQNLMRRAARISTQAHNNAMRCPKQGRYEYQIEADLYADMRRQGATALAYESIVAGGKNACILHYTDNNKPLQPGDLLLIDAGAEYHGYAADITRTFPVSGHFSGPQKELYELTLHAQMATMELVKPGLPWDQLHDTAVRIIAQGLLDLGLLTGTLDAVLEQKTYRRFFMHGTGHWLGLDVHDVGDYRQNDGRWQTLEPGMVFTIEPGIYVPADDKVDPQWHGIGIRIEDDVLVNAQGCENLTEAAAKTVTDIEALCGDRT